MVTKLTLSVEKQVIERAKIYSKQTGRSLSDIVERFLETLVSEDPSNHRETISPKLKSLVGAVKLPEDFDEDAAKRSYLEDKHL